MICTDVSKISFKSKEIQCRILKGFSKNEFLSNLIVFTNNIDVDLITLWNTFRINLISLYDRYAPISNYPVNWNAQPWITDEIVQEIGVYIGRLVTVTKSIRNVKFAYCREKIVKNNKLSSPECGNRSKLFWETNIVPPIY